MTERDARELFHRLAKELALPTIWHFKFDRAKMRFGCCDWQRRTITLSLPMVLLNKEKDVAATIRHEIAHALVGPNHGHDRVWRAMAIRCGDDGGRCYDETIATPEARYVATCPGCGRICKRNRKVRIGRMVSCKRCSGGSYNPRFQLNYRLNNSSELNMMNNTTLRAGMTIKYEDSLWRVEHCNYSRARIMPLSKRSLEAEEHGGVSISSSAMVDIVEDVAATMDEIELARAEAELEALRKEAAMAAAVTVAPPVPAAKPAAPVGAVRATRGQGWQRSGKAASFRSGSIAEVVLAFITRNPGMTALQIAECVDANNAASIKAYVSRFYHEGLLVKA